MVLQKELCKIYESFGIEEFLKTTNDTIKLTQKQDAQQYNNRLHALLLNQQLIECQMNC